MGYNEELQGNNNDLTGVLNLFRSLPTAVSSSERWETVDEITLSSSLASYNRTFESPVKKARLTVFPKVQVNNWKQFSVNNVSVPVHNTDLGAVQAITVTVDSTCANGYFICETGVFQSPNASGVNGGSRFVTYNNFANIADGILNIGIITTEIIQANSYIRLDVIR